MMTSSDPHDGPERIQTDDELDRADVDVLARQCQRGPA
jgi:hypothetical protein